MRTLEIVTAVCAGLVVLWPAVPLPRHPWRPALALLGAGAALAQVLVEGYRWQMIPLYGLAVVLLAVTLAGLRRAPPGARRPTGWRTVLALVALALAAALPALLPIPQLPTPTGPYAVGTVTWEFVDNSRTDPYAPDPTTPRRLMAQAWYPAAPQSRGDTTPWINDAPIIAPAIAQSLHLPSFFLDHVALAHTHSHAGADPVADPRTFPVLLFSHGWTGFRQQSTFLMEELASHGYVVVAVEHTYGAITTVFPDGTIARSNPAALPVDLPADQSHPAAQRLGDQWAGDLSFVLDRLTALNIADPDGRFTGRLDLERVGALGHSTGGGAALEFCGRDARCRAVLGLDAYMQPVSTGMLQHGLQAPLLALFSETWSSPANSALFEDVFQASPRATAQITITGTSHYDFSDMPAFSPLAPYIGLKGPLDGARVLQIVDTYAVAFFDRVLKDEDRGLLDGPSPDFPEAQFRRK
jgi:hypothetical protein